MAGNYPFRRAASLSGAVLLLTLGACHDKDKPEVPRPNPCIGQTLPVLAFDFIERIGNTTPDTAVLGDVTFAGPGAPYTSWEWRVGDDPRSFTQQRFSLFFGNPNRYYTYPVRLIARRPPNVACFPKDDGVDTLTKMLTLVPYGLSSSPLVGRFRGANLDAPADTFTVRFTAEPDRRYNDPSGPRVVYLNNLPNRTCPYNVNEEVGGGWRGASINGIGCGSAYGTAQIAEDRRTVRIEYIMFPSNDITRVNRVFVGYRVR